MNEAMYTLMDMLDEVASIRAAIQSTADETAPLAAYNHDLAEDVNEACSHLGHAESFIISIQQWLRFRLEMEQENTGQ